MYYVWYDVPVFTSCSQLPSQIRASLFRYSRFVALTTKYRLQTDPLHVPPTLPFVVLFSPLGAPGDYHGLAWCKIHIHPPPLQNRAVQAQWYKPYVAVLCCQSLANVAKEALPSPASKLSSSRSLLTRSFCQYFLQFLLL